MPRTLTASDRASLIRLASSLPTGSPERKAILAGLSKTSSGSQIGYLYAAEGHYGDALYVYLEGNKARLVVTSWAQIGGMDSMFGASKPEQAEERVVPASGKAIVAAIKMMMKNPKHIFLKSYGKPSEFKWYLGFGDWAEYNNGIKPIEGLSAAKAQAVVDSYNMPIDTWKAQYLKPEVKPSGGPFVIGPSTPFKEVLQQVEAQGFKTKPARNYRGKVVTMLSDARRIKQLLLLLEASADAKKKGQDENGWELFQFDFGGRKIEVGREYIDYANRWAIKAL